MLEKDIAKNVPNGFGGVLMVLLFEFYTNE
jgi:hypothetical protein